MQTMLSLLKRFQADERGVFLVIFGVMAIVLVATSGAVVDYTAIEQARTRAQTALDTAALGLQPTIYDNPAPTTGDIKTEAENLLVQQLNATGGEGWAICDTRTVPPCVRVNEEQIVIDEDKGTLHLEATLNIPTAFVSLIGFPSMSARLVSEATREKLNLEVVMVLDQSNSMNQSSRMANLIAASKCAVNILFSNGCANNDPGGTNDNVRVGVVPFTMNVNVGTDNAGASWLDRSGSGSTNITSDNFDSDDNESTPFNGPIDRVALIEQMNNVDWGGCVEARKTPYDTNDAQPVAGTDTMFTPLFAPDEPSGFYNDYIPDSPPACNSSSGVCEWTEQKTRCSSYNRCSGAVTNTYVPVPNPNATSCTCPGRSYLTDTGTNVYTGSGSNRTYTRVRTCRPYTPTGLSNRELQERMCKYTGTATGLSPVSARGPNADCPATAITPLSDNKATVISSINAMASQGGTNIHAGAIWGFHVLSPTQPFDQALPYDEETSKVMILMTDGENTAYKSSNMNGSAYYSFYGYPWNERMGTNAWTDDQLEAEMDRRLLATCANIKAEGIKIYTVGLAAEDTSDPRGVEEMLKTCSSGSGYYYFPKAASELRPVFEEIASQLSKLRLSK